MNRECFFCGNEWKDTEIPKCRCYREIKPGIMVKCPPRDKRIDLQMCYVCPLFTDCGEREDAQMDKMRKEDDGTDQGKKG